DLVEIAVKHTREHEMHQVRPRAQDVAEERILDALLPGVPVAEGNDANSTRQRFRKMLREGKLDDKEVEIEVAQSQASMEIFAPPGMEELTQQIQGMFQNLGGMRRKRRTLAIREALRLLTDEEAAKLVNEEEIRFKGRAAVQQ